MAHRGRWHCLGLSALSAEMPALLQRIVKMSDVDRNVGWQLANRQG